MKIIIVDEQSDLRIDKYLIEILNISRSKIQRLIEDNKILVNDNIIKNSYIVRVDDEIKIDEEIQENNEILPVNMKLNIVYEDKYMLVINKPSGLVVHPAAGHYNDTLVNGLMYHYNLSNDNNRAGIVHRIDKDTSGLLLVAKDDDTHLYLSKEIQKRKVNRIYLALVSGVISHDTGTIDAPIGRDNDDRKKMKVTEMNSKDAVTHFKVLKRYKNSTLVECKLDTGRTHQIRVHMQYIGYPIINDPLYSNKKPTNDYGQMLHAKKIGFCHPITKEYMEFSVEPEEEFNELVKKYAEE